MTLAAEGAGADFTAPLDQPYTYARKELTEPDWRRYPGWGSVTDAEWQDPQWQRSHSVKNIRQLRAVVGDLLDERFYDDLATDQQHRSTMSMLVPPQMLNTMAPHLSPRRKGLTDSFYADPIRRYMLPVFSDRDPEWPSHPHAQRDSLRESEMWVVEGLTHRYPTKVLAELVSTCPQYCGHCTRMDLVGNSTPTVSKTKLVLRPVDRQARMLAYLRSTSTVRDVVVSGGDVSNVPWPQLESFLMQLLEIDNIRDIRLASKAVGALPQHWLQAKVLDGLHRTTQVAAARGVNLAVHTHINHVQSVTPLVVDAARALRKAGLRYVRNQGVLLRGVNNSADDLLDLSFALQDDASILPYYFYMCDMVPNAEHWRIPLYEAQQLQLQIMGYLPGFATPRLVCDVPYVGKRWVHQVGYYDRNLGVSYWSKNYRTGLDGNDVDALNRLYRYYDPIGSLPASGRQWWSKNADRSSDAAPPVSPASSEAGSDAAEPISATEDPSADSLSPASPETFVTVMGRLKRASRTAIRLHRQAGLAPIMRPGHEQFVIRDVAEQAGRLMPPFTWKGMR